MTELFDTVVLDLDGTLVDSNYHHVLAWQRAFQRVAIETPAVRIHQAIGMGGDKFVAHVAGDHVERALGDQIRQLHDDFFMASVREVHALPGVDDFIARILELDCRPVLASSSAREQVDAMLETIESAHRLELVVTGDDADDSKPEPDLVQVALERVGSRRGVLVGDSVWDVAAARNSGIDCLAVLTGGFCREDLLQTGARRVYDDLPSLTAALPSLAHADPSTGRV